MAKALSESIEKYEKLEIAYQVYKENFCYDMTFSEVVDPIFGKGSGEWFDKQRKIKLEQERQKKIKWIQNTILSKTGTKKSKK
jgi:hypothetical protein